MVSVGDRFTGRAEAVGGDRSWTRDGQAEFRRGASHRVARHTSRTSACLRVRRGRSDTRVRRSGTAAKALRTPPGTRGRPTRRGPLVQDAIRRVNRLNPAHSHSVAAPGGRERGTWPAQIPRVHGGVSIRPRWPPSYDPRELCVRETVRVGNAAVQPKRRIAWDPLRTGTDRQAASRSAAHLRDPYGYGGGGGAKWMGTGEPCHRARRVGRRGTRRSTSTPLARGVSDRQRSAKRHSIFRFDTCRPPADWRSPPTG
jgi:hypothetical protein